MAHRKSRRRLGRQGRKAGRGLRDFLGRGGFRRGPDFRLFPESQAKMSEVLMEFMEPYRDLARTDDDFEKLTGIAALAWNASILPDDEAKETLEAERMYQSDADFRELIDAIMERKRKHFANNSRYIISYEICGSRDDSRLLVASTLT